MSRVYCLYRVSAVQQLHEDDIPMQRQACREFAAVRGWKKNFTRRESPDSSHPRQTAELYSKSRRMPNNVSLTSFLSLCLTDWGDGIRRLRAGN